MSGLVHLYVSRATFESAHVSSDLDMPWLDSVGKGYLGFSGRNTHLDRKSERDRKNMSQARGGVLFIDKALEDQ